jgi:hypothetical protein
MKKVISCPEWCPFDWVQFHKDLDIAMAHAIEELSDPIPGETWLPNKVSVMDFARYSNKKQQLQKLNKDPNDPRIERCPNCGSSSTEALRRGLEGLCHGCGGGWERKPK